MILTSAVNITDFKRSKFVEAIVPTVLFLDDGALFSSFYGSWKDFNWNGSITDALPVNISAVVVYLNYSRTTGRQNIEKAMNLLLAREETGIPKIAIFIYCREEDKVQAEVCAKYWAMQ